MRLRARRPPRAFKLMAERVGDIMVLADEETVFGVMEEAEREVRLRSHGSLHESTVPLWVLERA